VRLLGLTLSALGGDADEPEAIGLLL